VAIIGDLASVYEPPEGLNQSQPGIEFVFVNVLTINLRDRLLCYCIMVVIVFVVVNVLAINIRDILLYYCIVLVFQDYS
jgi:hypothetical protein